MMNRIPDRFGRQIVHRILTVAWCSEPAISRGVAILSVQVASQVINEQVRPHRLMMGEMVLL
jgi:hypothetical protein